MTGNIAIRHKGSILRRYGNRVKIYDRPNLVEGIAQYYTHLSCERMNSRITGIFDAYDKLLENQPEAYRTHLSWVDDCSPNVVRMAIIEASRNKVTALSEFESILTQASSLLHKGIIASSKSYEFLGSHGVRFCLGRNPFFALHCLPDSVFGPVDNPPCNLHLPAR